MAVFSVHLPGASAAATVADAAFVREGFCRAAFFLGPLWLLARGLWLSAALWFVKILAILSLVGAGLLSSGAGLTLVLLLQLLLGLEANRLIEGRLRRRGYALAEIIAAPGRDEAELAFYRQAYRQAGAGGATARGRAAPQPGLLEGFPAPEA
jgi:hypothetical protein